MARLDSTAFNLPSPLDFDRSGIDLIDIPSRFLRAGQLFTEELDQLAREAGLPDTDDEDAVNLVPPEPPAPPQVMRSLVPESGPVPDLRLEPAPRSQLAVIAGAALAGMTVMAGLLFGLVALLVAIAAAGWWYYQQPAVPVVMAEPTAMPARSYDVAALEKPAPAAQGVAVEPVVVPMVDPLVEAVVAPTPTVEAVTAEVRTETRKVEDVEAPRIAPAAEPSVATESNVATESSVATEPGVATEPSVAAEPVATEPVTTEDAPIENATPAVDEAQLVKILTLPPTAALAVDGIDRGRTPSKLELATGTHEVTVTSGTTARTFTVDVAAGTDNRWCYTFSQESAIAGPCPR